MPEPVAGTVNVANDVLADLAGYASLESYGGLHSCFQPQSFARV
jgi:hypothetical protein